MTRLNHEREKELQPIRMEYAINKLTHLGYEVETIDEKSIQFEHKGSTIQFFPYSGWATGKTIQDGRGIKNLLKQLK